MNTSDDLTAHPLTGAVVVLYRPDPPLALQVVQNLAHQADRLCVVDNTPGADLAPQFSHLPNCTYLPMGDNLGIAAAQNAGVRQLRSQGCRYILFSDQDSIAPDGLLATLLRTHMDLEQAGHRVGAVGPLPIQRSNGRPILESRSLLWQGTQAGHRVMQFDAIISSWSLIKTDTLDEVGPMRESLFIDGVDFEWCWRACYRHNRPSYVMPDLEISHMLGEPTDGPIRISTPFRIYFQFRNYLRLTREPYVPRWWKLKHALKYTAKAVYYPLFMRPRAKYLQRILLGVRDGLRRTPR